MVLKNFLLVAAGGGIGAVLRYAAALLIPQSSFPTATWLINIVGSFAIGLIIAWSLRTDGLSESGKLFLATGICGGFTTFSAFSYENLHLLQAGRYNLALLYIVTSVVLGIVAAWLGFKLMHA